MIFYPHLGEYGVEKTNLLLRHSHVGGNDGIVVWLMALLVMLLCIQPLYAAEVPKVEPLSPALSAPIKVSVRTNGYTLGDIIEMHAVIDLKKGQTFDPDSVPLKGPVNNWLDLREVKLFSSKNEDDSTHIQLDFTWQVFGTVEIAQKVYIPAIALQTIPPTTGDTRPITIKIPAQGFHLSPVLPPNIEEKTHRPHAPPLRFDTYTPLSLAWICLGLGLLFGGMWIWVQDKIAWWPRNPGPLTKLARQMRGHQGARFSEQDLRAIHTGLAASAGQSLYPNTLGNLFEKCPYLSSDKAEITQFFNTSWQVFHRKNASMGAVTMPETKAWIHRAAMAERLARQKEKKHQIAFKTKRK
ncbi:MAG: hypothetical protein HOP21_00420 [Methylotenera sp.]|nr:hypothetical protein [Methylotenera sp.]